MKRLLLLLLLPSLAFCQLERSGRRVLGLPGLSRAGSSTVALPFTDNFAAASLGIQWKQDAAYGPTSTGFLCVGDSKTTLKAWRPYLYDSLYGYNQVMPPFAASGWTMQNARDSMTAHLAKINMEPSIILFNIGVNDTWGNTVRDSFVTAGTQVLDTLHARYPSAIMFMSHVWSSAATAARVESVNAFIDYLISIRPSFVYAGHDERVWLEGGDAGATYTLEGTHYNAAGNKMCASQWKSILLPYISRTTTTTWSVSSGVAANSPRSMELLINGGMEYGDPPSSWDAYAGATIDRSDDEHSGSYALNVITSTGTPANHATDLGVDTSLVTIDGWIKRMAGSNAGFIQWNASPSVLSTGSSSATSYARVFTSGLAFGVNGTLRPTCNPITTNDSYNFDDISFKKLYPASCIQYIATGLADVDVSAKVSVSANNLAGVVVSYADNNNFVVACIDSGATSRLQLIKRANASWTKILDTTISYVAGSVLRILKSGTTYQVFYKGPKVGQPVTISDASLINNTKHGLFSMYSGNTLDDFSCSASSYTPSNYILQDDFRNAISAGSLNGTFATDSINVRTVTDTENKLSVTAAGLVFASGKATPAAGNPGVWYPRLSRTAGRMMLMSYKDTSNNTNYGISFGFDSDVADKADEQSIYRTNNSNHRNVVSYSGTTVSPAIVDVNAGYVYQSAVVLRTVGSFLLMRDSTSAGNWVLRYPRSTGNSANIYPRVANYNSIFTFKSIRIPTALWMPTPSLSDGFTTTFGTSDGKGHAEGVAGTLGSGGSGVAWTGAGWRSVGGKAVDSTATNLAAKIASVQTSTPDVIFDVDSMVVNAGDSVGIVLNLNSTTAPDTFVVAYYSGANVHLDKVVGGTWTSLINTAATYSANATLRVVKEGTSYQVYYNNAKIGTTQTITEIVTVGRHGLFSTGPLSSFARVCVWDCGSTTGAYNSLTAYLP